MTKKDASKIARAIGKILGSRCTVYSFDDETLYINTCSDFVDFAQLMKAKEKYNITGVMIDDDYEGFIILQIDLLTEEERKAEEELGNLLFEMHNPDK